MKMKLSGLCVMAAIFLSSCSAPTETPVIDLEKLKVEIQQMEDAYSTAEKAKDANAVVAYYSDDAISYSRNQEPSVGKAAITERIAERLAKDTSGVVSTYKIVDLFAADDMIVEIGSWIDTDSTGNEVKKGHYMSYFQKRDGKYLCVRDMSVNTTPENITQ